MKKILFLVLFLCASLKYAYSDDPSPLAIKVSIQGNNIILSKENNQSNSKADIQIVNKSTVGQLLGRAGDCCVRELDDLISDNPSIDVISKGSKDRCPSETRTCSGTSYRLMPGHTWKQTCVIAYKGEKGKSGPVTFRIGFSDVNQQQPDWSDPVTVNVTDART
jgi:hypothetical protein